MSTLKVNNFLDITGSYRSAGRVLQVVESEQTIARFSTTSTSFQNTGFFVNITPTSSTSKVLVLVSAVIYGVSDYAHLTIYRDTTDLADWSGEGFLIGGYGYWSEGSIKHLDSPSTTSQVSYKIYLKSNAGGTAYCGRNAATGTNCQVTMQAMEIAA